MPFSVKTFTRYLSQVLPRGSLGRGVILISGGTAFAQVILAVTAPLLTRLYTPSDFGQWAVFTSILSTVAVVSALRYELAIPLASRAEDAGQLVLLASSIVVGTSLIGGIALVLLRHDVERWSGADGFAAYVWLIPPTLLAVGGYQVLNYWTTRGKRFGLLAVSRVVQSSSQVFMQIIAGVLRFGASGLIVGYAASRFFGLATLTKGANLPEIDPSLRRWKTLGTRYRKFPLFTVWGSLINVVGIQFPPLLIASFFTLGNAGFFSLTLRIMTIPSTLLAQSVTQVFYVTAADYADVRSRKALVESVSLALLVISFPVFAFVGFYGPTLFGYVFGSEWATAGVFARYMAPWFMLSFVSAPIGSYVFVSGKQREAFFISLYETGLRLGAIAVGVFYESVDLAVVLFAGAGIVISSVYIAWVLRLVGSSLLEWLHRARVYVSASLVLLLALILVYREMGSFSPVAAMVTSALGLTGFGIWSLRWCRRASRRRPPSDRPI